jgi:peptide/nickel transport system ATP-binding protein
MNGLLDVRNLGVEIATDEGRIAAVRDVSFSVEAGKCTGVIGESGCGKSMTALAVMDLLPSTARVVSGQILFRGDDLLRRSAAERARLRGTGMAMIFQDAIAALNPVLTVGEQIRDVLRATAASRGGAASLRTAGDEAEIIRMLARVGVTSPERRVRQYPHELSGGMRQRVLIAMALLCRPELVIADEPTTALDVTTEAQIVELIRGLIREFAVSFVLITHNLSLIAELCDRVVVLYRGSSVEEASVDALFARPLHPYTRGLMSSMLTLNTARDGLRPIRGAVPHAREAIAGCQFHPRCPDVMATCSQKTPLFVEVEPGHRCACFLHSAAAVPGSR